jgi:thiol-disulfide isomerase/thioredoxin
MRKSLAAVFCLIAASFALAAAQLPRKSPELQMQVPNGKTILLSQYKGKPVVLAFILTTCTHCQYTTGLLVKMQNEYGPKGLQVLECAVNTGADNLIPAFTQTFKTNFPVGYNFDQDFILSTYLQHPMDKNPSMPMLVFIDRRGTIRAQYEGGDDFISNPNQEQNIRGEIQKLLAVPAAAHKSR